MKKRLTISVIAVGSHKVAGVRRTHVRRLSQCNIHFAHPCNRPENERRNKSIAVLTTLHRHGLLVRPINGPNGARGPVIDFIWPSVRQT